MTRKTKRSDIDYKLGSGNVYANLAFADSHKMLAKARLVAQISRTIQGTSGRKRKPPNCWVLINSKYQLCCPASSTGIRRRG